MASMRLRRLVVRNAAARRDADMDEAPRRGEATGVNLIILDRHEVSSSHRVTLSDARALHLIAVLKVVPGSHVRIGVLDGPLGLGTVVSVSGGCVGLECAFDQERPPDPQTDVLLALPRPKVLRRLWAQFAALGVGRIMLTNAERVERHYFDTHVLTPECYRPLLIEGLQQAKDTRLPVVSVHRRFKVFVEDELDELFPAGRRLVADAHAAVPIAAALNDRAARRVLLAIGPEGGWSRFELDLLHRHGFEAVSLGPRTLRSDTACIALIAVVQQMTQAPLSSVSND
jgi:RsmE family RNA methyltransferase